MCFIEVCPYADFKAGIEKTSRKLYHPKQRQCSSSMLKYTQKILKSISWHDCQLYLFMHRWNECVGNSNVECMIQLKEPAFFTPSNQNTSANVIWQWIKEITRKMKILFAFFSSKTFIFHFFYVEPHTHTRIAIDSTNEEKFPWCHFHFSFQFQFFFHSFIHSFFYARLFNAKNVRFSKRMA